MDGLHELVQPLSPHGTSSTGLFPHGSTSSSLVLDVTYVPMTRMHGLLIKGVQSGPPVDNIMLCGHFAASCMCEITGNGDKLISNQV